MDGDKYIGPCLTLPGYLFFRNGLAFYPVRPSDLAFKLLAIDFANNYCAHSIGTNNAAQDISTVAIYRKLCYQPPSWIYQLIRKLV
jgi:hypothetical protein